jgi:hypothetical protein
MNMESFLLLLFDSLKIQVSLKLIKSYDDFQNTFVIKPFVVKKEIFYSSLQGFCTLESEFLIRI